MFNQDGRTCKEEREREKERDRLLSLAGLCRLPSHDSVGMKWNKISNTDNCQWKEITEIAFEVIGGGLVCCSKAACPLEQWQDLMFHETEMKRLFHKFQAKFLRCEL